MSGDHLTIGQVAKLLSCCPRTATKWFDSGLLKGYRMPGPRGFRRVLRASVFEFARAHGIPIEQPEASASDQPT